MKISQLISELERQRALHGDIHVCIVTGDHDLEPREPSCFDFEHGDDLLNTAKVSRLVIDAHHFG